MAERTRLSWTGGCLAFQSRFAKRNSTGRFRGLSGRAPFSDEGGSEGILQEGLTASRRLHVRKEGLEGGLKGASRGLQGGLKGASRGIEGGFKGA